MNRLHDSLAQVWLNIQDSLFPWLTEELGTLNEKQETKGSVPTLQHLLELTP